MKYAFNIEVDDGQAVQETGYLFENLAQTDQCQQTNKMCFDFEVLKYFYGWEIVKYLRKNFNSIIIK